jgi:hypothetical protein
MTYEFKNGKYVICKDGVYFALTKDQVKELISLLHEINEKL